ncbi:MAG: FtsW/RodA/SpoVE family cell cycle protein [Muribaculaceae bacterium]|nr:FtsW/RodA/SpoVE family cell cycle protein [Muribaculaceae bacterium]
MNTIAAEADIIRPRVRTDHQIWGIYIVLLIFSIIELFSASSQEVRVDDIYGPLVRHAQFLVMGLGAMLVIQHFHYRYIVKAIPWLIGLSIAAMLYVLVAGVTINGARRGMRIAGMVILPAEFIKLAVALGVALIMSRYQVKGRRDVSTHGIVLCVALTLVSSGLLFTQGLTNTLLLMCISVAMMAIGGVGFKKFWCVIGIYLLIGGGAVLVKIVAAKSSGPTPEAIEVARLNQEEVGAGNERDRSATWFGRVQRHFRLNKHADPITDINKQEQLSYIAQAHGGITGVGPGKSRENARLPLAFSDYIYAIVVEECGLVFSIFLLLCYLWLLMRAGYVGISLRRTPACFLMIGCGIYIVVQALFHMAIVSGVFPVSGQPLPLISKGGTSVLATSIALGVMLSVSRHAARTDDKDTEAATRELQSLPENLRTDNPTQL